MKTKIIYVGGVEGNSFYIGDIRVAGNKAWGGGKIIEEKETSIEDILYALNNIYSPSHQPLGTELAEAEHLLKNIRRWV